MAGRPQPVLQQEQPVRRRGRGRRILLVVGLVSLILIVGVFVSAQYLLHNAEPILRERVIETLAARFDSRVELAEFHVSVVNGLQVSGAGLKLYPNAYSSDVPLFAADEFGFRTTWANLLKTPMHVGHVGVNGLRIHLPPKQERHDLPKLNGKGRGEDQDLCQGDRYPERRAGAWNQRSAEDPSRLPDQHGSAEDRWGP